MATPEIRFTITERLDIILKAIAEECGVDKSDYVRSLILNDLRNKGGLKKKNGKKNKKLYSDFFKASQKQLITSAISVTRGGIGIALVKTSS